MKRRDSRGFHNQVVWSGNNARKEMEFNGIRSCLGDQVGGAIGEGYGSGRNHRPRLVADCSTACRGARLRECRWVNNASVSESRESRLKEQESEYDSVSTRTFGMRRGSSEYVLDGSLTADRLMVGVFRRHMKNTFKKDSQEAR